MLDEKDIKFIEQLIKERTEYYKNQRAGTRHFLEYKLRTGQPESLIRADKKEIEELTKKIEYTSNLLIKVNSLRDMIHK